MDCKIRVLKISVKNLKNLKDGSIEFESYKNVLSGNFNFEKSDIVGIYGQNGSSKSTIINANIQVIPEKQNLVPIKFGETEIDESGKIRFDQ